MQGTLISNPAHGRIVGNAIGHGRHGPIVVGQKNDGWWRQVTDDGILVGERAHQRLISLRRTEEAVDRSFMGLTLVHRDDRIEKNGKVGTAVVFAMC